MVFLTKSPSITSEVVENQVQMKIKRGGEKKQEKTKISNCLCTKGVTYSKYLGRVSKSPNKHILTLRGKDLFRNPTKLKGL